MIKWHSFLEYIQFPLKVIFFATILMGIGNIVGTPFLGFSAGFNNETILRFSELFRFLGGFLFTLFPLLVFIKILSKKFEDSVPVFVGIFSYVVIIIVMMFFTKQQFPLYFYHNVLGISVNIDAVSTITMGVPFNIGIIGLLLSYAITAYVYKRSRRYSMYGVASFIDHDAYAMIFVFVLSILAGISLAYIWPLVIQGIQAVFLWVGSDITNPFNLFLYGVFERLSAPLGLLNIPREVFWFGELGGSWMDVFGTTFLGDVNIFMIQQNIGTVISSSGRFITPYYIINIFLIPSIYLGYYSLVTNKRDRNRYALFFIIAMVVSILFGNPFPVEMYLLFMAPVVYVIYIVVVGALYAILAISNVFIGFNFSGVLISALPGSGFELISFLQSPERFQQGLIVLIIGIVIAIFFYFVVRLYFKKFAIGLFEIHTIEDTCNEVIFALGGLENIKDVDATPDKLMVSLYDKQYIDVPILKELGAYLIFESREGYLIRLGNINIIMADSIKKRMNNIEM